jgi:hypothetical protein
MDEDTLNVWSQRDWLYIVRLFYFKEWVDECVSYCVMSDIWTLFFSYKWSCLEQCLFDEMMMPTL